MQKNKIIIVLFTVRTLRRFNCINFTHLKDLFKSFFAYYIAIELKNLRIGCYFYRILKLFYLLYLL